MFKKIPSILLVLVLLVLVPKSIFAATTSVTGHKIIIDAGHGGDDYGSTACPNLPEKDVNIQIAYDLKYLLEEDLASVYMIRSGIETLSNNDRYTNANNSGGEVLVS